MLFNELLTSSVGEVLLKILTRRDKQAVGLKKRSIIVGRPRQRILDHVWGVVAR